MKTPRPNVRFGPKPMPPSPIERFFPSPVANAGRWHVMHAMLRLPLKIGSNASACPSLTSSGRTCVAKGSATIPCVAASARSESAAPCVGARERLACGSARLRDDSDVRLSSHAASAASSRSAVDEAADRRCRAPRRAVTATVIRCFPVRTAELRRCRRAVWSGYATRSTKRTQSLTFSSLPPTQDSVMLRRFVYSVISLTLASGLANAQQPSKDVVATRVDSLAAAFLARTAHARDLGRRLAGLRHARHEGLRRRERRAPSSGNCVDRLSHRIDHETVHVRPRSCDWRSAASCRSTIRSPNTCPTCRRTDRRSRSAGFSTTRRASTTTRPSRSGRSIGPRT